MANRTMDLDFEIPGQGNGKGKKSRRPSKKFSKLFLIVSAAVLVAALAVAAVLLMSNQESVVRIMDFGTAIKGVSVGGIDIGGLTRQQVIEKTAQLETNMLAGAKVSLDVNGELHEFEAWQLSITTDYTDIINQAMDYGHIGTFDDRKAAAEKAKTEGVSFDIKLSADENTIATALANLKSVLDKAPQDASVVFTPWGHTANADGTFTPYTPDLPTIINMCKTYAKKTEFTRPELVRIPENEMPLATRYEFWRKGTGYVKDFRPADANIARFIYTPEVTGLIANTSEVIDDIMAQVESGSFSTITVPVQVTEPAVKLADIKADTQLISSWSSYWGGSHDGYERNYNVSMISSLINGNILEPGVEWSVNKTVGDRDKEPGRSKYGWKKAAGIENGGYTPQYGGGVCQLGSTTFNAIIRASSEITIVKQMHHTIPSDYIPLGLDATLSSGTRLDLIVKNEGTMPYYLVSYINPKEKYVTVEVYGPPLVDKSHPEWGNVLYHFTSNSKGSYGDPQYKTVYCEYVEKEAPDGTIINAGNPEYEFAKNRKGTRVQTYKHIYSLDGTLLWEGEFQPQYSYPVINGTMYYWGYAPGTEPSTPPGTSEPPASPPPSPTATTGTPGSWLY